MKKGIRKADYGRHDLVISLKTGPNAIPENNAPGSFIALGHFDSATISIAEKSSFVSFHNPYVSNGSADYNNDVETQMNYLIHYNKNKACTRSFAYRFMMSIAVNLTAVNPTEVNPTTTEQPTLEKYACWFNQQLQARIGSSIHWSIYFPIARGDIVILFSGNDFVKATDCLYKFVHNNKYILYSYTIPLISWEMIRSGNLPSANEISGTQVRTRATVKDYEWLYSFANNVILSRKDNVSFGTDDVFIDWGLYSDRKIKEYFSILLNTPNGGLHPLYKKSAYSTELEISKIRPEVDTQVEKKTSGEIISSLVLPSKKEERLCLIHEVFDPKYFCDSETAASLKRLFISQLYALYRIIDLDFFRTLANSFGNAIEAFLKTARAIEHHPEYSMSKDLHDRIVNDSVSFIKAFDTALQGYLNSDRQFLEFPGHHVSLYDLPVKLGTLYVNFINRAVYVFEKEPSSKAFLLCPEPSYAEGPHSSLLLSGSYNQQSSNPSTSSPPGIYVIATTADSLFSPRDLLLILAHEVAHFVNRRLRLPEQRNQMLFDLNWNEFSDTYISNIRSYIDVVLENYPSCDSETTKAICKERDLFIKSVSEKLDIAKDEFYKEFVKQNSALSEVCFRDVSVIIDNIFTPEQTPHRRLMDYTANKFEVFCQKLPLYSRLAFFNVDPSFNTILENPYVLHRYSNQEIDYLTKECVADILSLQLLDVNYAFENYTALLEKEISKEKKKRNRQMPRDNKCELQMLRLYLVETVFHKPLSRDIGQFCDAKGYLYEGFGEDHMIYIIENTRKELIKYLNDVKSGFQCDDNDARKMYSEIAKAQTGNGIDTSVLIKYML